MNLRSELRAVTPDEATKALESFVGKLEGDAKDVTDTLLYPGLFQIGRLAVEVVDANRKETHEPRDIAMATMTYMLGTLIELAEGREFTAMFPDMPETPTV